MGKRLDLTGQRFGYFSNLKKAVAIRKQAEQKYFGKYCYDNSMKIALKNSIERT